MNFLTDYLLVKLWSILLLSTLGSSDDKKLAEHNKDFALI